MAVPDPSTPEEPIHAVPVARIVGRVVFFAVMAVALYLFLPGVLALFGSFDQLRSVSWWWFVGMIAAEAASYGLVTLITALLLPGTSPFGITCAQLTGHVMSTIVPGGAATGGAVQYRMLVTAGGNPAEVGSAMALQGVILTAAVFTLPVFALPAVILGAPAPNGLVATAIIGFGFFLALVAVAVAAIRSDRALRAVVRIVATAARLARRPLDPVALGERVLSERDKVRHLLGRRWWQLVALAIGKWTLEYAALLLALAAVGARPRPSLVLLAYTASAVLSMIPITPGGLGFVEAGLAATLALAGVPPAAATVATLAYRLVTYWLPLPVGAVLWVVFRHKFPHQPATAAEPTAA